MNPSSIDLLNDDDFEEAPATPAQEAPPLPPVWNILPEIQDQLPPK